MDYIFNGPTLSKIDIKNILPNAIVKPPIKSSDIFNLLRNAREDCYPKRILIIDGFFHGKLSVRHKEILYAMNQNILVYGCSSMGALRAAECADFGMVGIGKIFNFFKTKFASSDDEVAVAYSADEPYEELSLPLINIRFALEDLMQRKLINKYQKEKIIKLIKGIHFTDRTFNFLNEIDYISKFIPLISKFYLNWKERDALEAVNIMKSKNNINLKFKKWKFNYGSFFLNYYSDTYVNYESEDQKDEYISGADFLNDLDFSKIDERLKYNAFNRIIAIKYADYLGIDPSENDILKFQKFIKKEGKIFFNETFSYVAKSSDPKIRYKFAKEELKIFLLHIILKNNFGDVGFSLPLQDYLTSTSLTGNILNVSEDSKNKFDYFEVFKELNCHEYQNINLQGRFIN